MAKRKSKSKKTAVARQAIDIPDLLASNKPLLSMDKSLSPREQWEAHKDLIQRMGVLATSMRNVWLLAVGQMYKRMKETPDEYWNEEEMGRVAPGSARALATELGVSHTTVVRGNELETNYAEKEIRHFALLTNQVLREAILIPRPRRITLLEKILSALLDGSLGAGEGIEIVRAAIEAGSGEDDATGEDDDAAKAKKSVSTTPPITQVRSRAMKLMTALTNLSEGVEDDTYLLSSDEIDTMAGVRDSLTDAVADLEIIIKTAEKKGK